MIVQLELETCFTLNNRTAKQKMSKETKDLNVIYIYRSNRHIKNTLANNPILILFKCIWDIAQEIRTLSTVCGNVKWYICYGKQNERPSKIKIKLLYDLTVPHLGMYPKELVVRS